MKVSFALIACVLSLAPMILASPATYQRDPVTGIMRKVDANPNSAASAYATPKNGKTVDLRDALPIVSNMDQYEDFNNALASYNEKPRPLAESLEATIEIMQDPAMASKVNIGTDKWVDALGAVFAKYETPIGLMNKLFELQRFDALEFVIDDSGSMMAYTDMLGPGGEKLRRWQEVQYRMKELLEILAYVPTKTIRICFLNRCHELALDRTQNQMSPEQFIQHTYQKLDAIFEINPTMYDRTPYVKKIRESLAQGGSIARYFFSDGQPTDRPAVEDSIAEIKKMVVERRNAQDNPVTFFSCTNDDKQVEWMKEVEEVAPFCGELDDYLDEANEVLKDQGRAFPFTKGMYLISSLVGAMNPQDLDAMDESIPFAKTTLENIQGIRSEDNAEYNRYFELFVQAQSKARFEAQEKARNTGEPISAADDYKFKFNWRNYFNEFTMVQNRNQIQAVVDFQVELSRLSGNPLPNQYQTGGLPQYNQPSNQQPGAYQSSPYGQQQQPGAYQSSPYGQQQQSGAYQSSPYGQQQQQQQPGAYQSSPYGQQQQAGAYQSSPYGQQQQQQQPGAYQSSPYGQPQVPQGGQFQNSPYQPQPQQGSGFFKKF